MEKCFKCKLTKPLSKFYTHPRMSDGHLNKCKGCAKFDSNSHRMICVKNAEWLERERKRCRDKKKPFVYNYKEGRAHRIRYHRKQKIGRAVYRAIKRGEIKKPKRCERCTGKPKRFLHAHHADYSKPLSVEFLCELWHGKEHRKL